MVLACWLLCSGVKAGTLGMFGVGKSLLVGKNKGITKRTIGALKTATIVKTTGFATKATIGSVLTCIKYLIQKIK